MCRYNIIIKYKFFNKNKIMLLNFHLKNVQKGKTICQFINFFSVNGCTGNLEVSTDKC